ncbi:MAG: type III pantothenate kinase [Thioalkalispiraceae bacterium]|jgi:type III pantothenate kinase
MKLLVDMGNSRIKWVTVSNGLLAEVNALPYEQLAVRLKEAWQQLEKPEQVYVCSVASQEQRAVVGETVRLLWNLDVEFITSQPSGFGVSNGYTEPMSLGHDRWVALVAAHRLYPSAVCLVDAGTALTLDGLTAEGQHLGGVIIPGIQTMKTSLVSNAAAITTLGEEQQLKNGQPGLAQDTHTGIINGCWLATIAIIEKMYTRLSKEYEDGVLCLLTGGNAEALADQLTIPATVDSSLVLKGLAIIAGEQVTQ